MLSTRRSRTWRGLALGVVAGALLAGCAGDGPSRGGANGIAASGGGGVDAAAVLATLPSDHVHGVAVNPADGRTYLATHEGLFVAAADGWTALGPVIDLMGFSVAGPDHFYASGHPGQGSDLPNPVGLIESKDGGQTWAPLSRQGESDFHALTAHAEGVVGYDGELRVSSDGTSWSTAQGMPAPAFSLASGGDGVVLATTERGLTISDDGGATWRPLDGAPRLLLVDWATGPTVAGVSPDGAVHVSQDSGRTWQEQGRIQGQPQALGASGTGDELRIQVVAQGTVTESRDAGVTFGALAP